MACSRFQRSSRGYLSAPIEGGEPRRISHFNASGSHRMPSISRDGRYWLMPFAAVMPRAMCTSRNWMPVMLHRADHAASPSKVSKFPGLAWSRDGHSLIYSGSLGGQAVVLVAGRNTGPAAAPKVRDCRSKRFLPINFCNGQTPGVYEGGRETPTLALPAGGGELEPLIVSSMDDNSPDFSPEWEQDLFFIRPHRRGDGALDGTRGWLRCRSDYQ